MNYKTHNKIIETFSIVSIIFVTPLILISIASMHEGQYNIGAGILLLSIIIITSLIYFTYFIKPSCTKRTCKNKMTRKSKLTWRIMLNRGAYYIYYTCEVCGENNKIRDVYD